MAMSAEQRKATGERLKAARAAAKMKHEAAQDDVPRETKTQTELGTAPIAQLSQRGDQSPVDEKIEAQVLDTAGMVTPDPNKPETIPPDLFSGFTKRLEYFGEREGFKRWWCNDDKGGTTIGRALKSGWTFVKRTDVQLNAAVTPRNNDLGSNIRQYVGTDDAGLPMYAYLMEKPKWLCDLHDFGPGSREEYHEQLEKQIRAGTIGMKRGEKRYTAINQYPGAGPSTLPPISIEKQTVK